MATRRKGFTLVELLVVVSIIALLIGILLPALGEARRSARMVQDIANLNEHGKGTSAYVAEQKGRMPNTRPDAAGGNKLGPRTTPKESFAYAGIQEINNGFALGGSGVAHGHLWKWYIPVFGDYIFDDTGFGLLADIFVSPGAGFIKSNWQFMREQARGQSSVEYLSTSSKYNVINSGAANFSHPDLTTKSNFDDTDLTWILTGSYRYTLSAIMGVSNVAAGGFAGTDFFIGKPETAFSKKPVVPWGGNFPSWAPWRAFVQQSKFAYASKKVLFWDVWASNSGAGFYLRPGAQVPVVFVDGSAKVTRPQRDMPSERTTVLAHSNNDPWGTQEEYVVKRSWDVEGFESDGGGEWTPAWFVMTMRGPGGRDF